MKFTNGYWQMRPGYNPHYPAHLDSYDLEKDALTVYAPTKRLDHRGDTLNLALLTVRFTSPMPDVIWVQVYQHKGIVQRQPQFDLLSQPPHPVSVQDQGEVVSITSGKLHAEVSKSMDWNVSFKADGKTLTQSGWRGMGTVDTPEGRFIHEQLGLGVGECVYGLGERFTPFVKNGQVIDIWNQDGGTSSEQAYKNIPFYLTNHGYGVWVNHPEHVSFEVASEKVTRVQFSVAGDSLDYYLIYGPTPKEILEKYTRLSGRPALPPPWSFGLWLSTSFTTDYDEETVTGFIQGMADRAIPLHVFHFDCFWMKAFHWINLEWDEDVFPDPEGMLRRLKDLGVRICLWINPYIAQRSKLFDEGMENGYLLKRPDGSVWQTDEWQAGMGIVDFTNPDARQWYQDRLRALVDIGVDTFKTDFGERIPTDVVYHDGSDPQRMHNYYSFIYNQTVFELLEEMKGEGNAVVFARSATSGGQRFPVHWGGDCTANYESMAESLRGGLSLGLSGFGFWSHDIGGFEQTAPAAVYKRWCAFGLLSSHSRLHGSGSYRVPWLFDEEAVDVLRAFTRLKCRLMPYLFGAAIQAHEQGTPMMRAMLLEFPDDPACTYLDRQYMLGDSLLVAPVFSSDGSVTYYVPDGHWTNYLSGTIVEGPGWFQETHNFLSLPLLVQQNTIILAGSRDDVPDYDYADGVTLKAYELAEGRLSVTVPDIEGGETTFQVERQGDRIRIEAQKTAKPWKFFLSNIHSITSLENGTVEDSASGILVIPEDPAQPVIITLGE